MGKKLLTIFLVLVLLLGDVSILLPPAGMREVQAGAPIVNAFLSFLRIGGALGRRNRVYRGAGATAEEIHAYYDRLIVQAQSTRQEMVARSQSGDLSPRLIGSYIRVEAALEAERQAAIQMIEVEKNQARRDFEKTLVKEITNVLVASPGGQRIIRRAGDAIWETRQVVVSAQRTLEEGKPTDLLGDLLADQVGDLEVAQELARGLGSVVGQRLDKMLGGVVGKIEKVIGNVQEGLAGGLEVLDQMSAEVNRLEEQGRQPGSLVEDGSMIGEILPVDRENPVVDVIASAYAGATMLSGRNDPNATRATMRDRIRGALLDARTAGIRELVSGQGVGQTYCNAVEWGEYEMVALQLGQTPQQVEDPAAATYLVCYDISSQAPVYARMYGSAKEQADVPENDSEGVEQPTQEETGPGDSVLGDYTLSGYAYSTGLFPVPGRKKVTFTLAKDGSVTGSVDLSLLKTFVNAGCAGQMEVILVGTFTGQILTSDGGKSFSGPIEFSGKKAAYMIESCGLADEEIQVNQTGTITINASGRVYGNFADLFWFDSEKP